MKSDTEVEILRALGRVEERTEQVLSRFDKALSRLDTLEDRTAKLERFDARILGASAAALLLVGGAGTLIYNLLPLIT